MKHIFIYGIFFSGTTLACCLAHSEVDVNFQNTLILKTFNFDRQYENDTSPDTHSLSQGVIYGGDPEIQVVFHQIQQGGRGELPLHQAPVAHDEAGEGGALMVQGKTGYGHGDSSTDKETDK